MGDGEGAKGGAPKPAAKPEPPTLPDGTPDRIKKFVACQAGGIRFKGGPLPFVKGKPKVGFEPGEKAGTIKISVGWGIASLSVTAEVKDGKLSIDASKVPDLSDFIDDSPKPQDFTDFADKFNEWLKSNGKQLGPLELKDGQLTIRKQAVPAAGKAALPGAAAPAPAPKPKEEGIKAGPGVGARTATGVGTVILGFTIGALVAPGGDQVSQAQPDEPVPVVRAQQGPQQMPVEERVVLQLPSGDVQGEITITGAPGSFSTPAVFRQTDSQLTLELPGSGLPPFKGPIDEAVEFEIRNQSGLFAGRFQGDRVSGDHEFQGEQFTFEGTIEKPVVEKTVTEGPPQQETVPMAGGIGDGVRIEPASTGGQGGVNVPGTVAGVALTLLGAGLVVGSAQGKARDCGPLREALDSAIANYRDAMDELRAVDRRVDQAANDQEERRQRLEELPGVELTSSGEIMASRPGTDEAVKETLESYNLGLQVIRELEVEQFHAEEDVGEARVGVRDAEHDLATCEERAPRSLRELVGEKSQPDVATPGGGRVEEVM